MLLCLRLVIVEDWVDHPGHHRLCADSRTERSPGDEFDVQPVILPQPHGDALASRASDRLLGH